MKFFEKKYRIWTTIAVLSAYLALSTVNIFHHHHFSFSSTFNQNLLESNTHEFDSVLHFDGQNCIVFSTFNSLHNANVSLNSIIFFNISLSEVSSKTSDEVLLDSILTQQLRAPPKS
jgi:hypothetical protein